MKFYKKFISIVFLLVVLNAVEGRHASYRFRIRHRRYRRTTTTTTTTTTRRTTNHPTCVDKLRKGYCEVFKMVNQCKRVKTRCLKTCEECNTTTTTATTTSPATTSTTRKNQQTTTTTPTTSTILTTTTAQSTPTIKLTTTATQTTQKPVLCGDVTVPLPRVINGIQSKPGQWPWQVGILRKGNLVCGGTLISTEWIITAGHCVHRYQTNQFQVELGVTNRNNITQKQTIDAAKIILHPQYNLPSTLNNDIAMIKLIKPVLINDYIRSVCLPEHYDVLEKQMTCFTSGWGKTSYQSTRSSILNHAELKVLLNNACQNVNNKFIPLTAKMFCSQPKGNIKQTHCHGDDGGPFVCKNQSSLSWKLFGVTSWGAPNCDDEVAHSVFVRLSKFLSWIKVTMKNE